VRGQASLRTGGTGGRIGARNAQCSRTAADRDDALPVPFPAPLPEESARPLEVSTTLATSAGTAGQRRATENRTGSMRTIDLKETPGPKQWLSDPEGVAGRIQALPPHKAARGGAFTP